MIRSIQPTARESIRRRSRGPNGIVWALILAALATAAKAGSEPAAPKASQAIRSTIQPFVDTATVPGAVALVADKQQILSVTVVGFADIKSRKPMQADDLFWIASMSKPMTATALMMLVDEGRVNVEDPVEKYLPEFHGQMVIAEQNEDHIVLKRPSHPTKVRELLTHTSGLPYVSRVEQLFDTRPLREAVLSYAMSNLLFDPGTKFSYANAGINTVGRIIEVVSGMPYEQFLQNRLLDPLGMKDTAFFPNKAQLARLPTSYLTGPGNATLVATNMGQFKEPLDRPDRYACPAAGLFSTATDVAAFGQLILNAGEFRGKRILSVAAVRQMTSKQTPLADYGFGFNSAIAAPADGSGTVPVGECGHGGSDGTDVTIYPSHELVTVWMSQQGAYPGNGMQAKGTFQRAAIQEFARDRNK